MLEIIKLNIIPTFDHEKESNGTVIPVFHEWNKFFEGKHPKFVYITKADPRKDKGPHLHLKRTSHLFVIQGTIIVEAKEENVKTSYILPIGYGIKIPPGIPMKIKNRTSQEATILNVATDHCWAPNDTDNYDVEDW